MNIIFQIDGGLGKSIMGTAITKVIRKRYKNAHIIVVTAYPDVFLNNPHINECFRVEEMSGAYLKYVKDQDCKIFIEDPYRNTSFLTEKEHLFETWCKIYDLQYNNEQPELYLSQPEIDYFKPFYQTEKPIMVIQPNGGPQGQGFQYSWTRDIPEPTVNEIIQHYKEDYTIVHIKREDQYKYPDTLHALDGFRSIAILLQLSKKRLLIDSFGQHLAAAMGVKSTVCWVTTKPKVFGYKLHDNIQANDFTKNPQIQNSIYQPFNLTQDVSSIPYNDLREVFDINKIVESINKQK
jgi:ADP-heptose:LPS heptosyltransferase